MRTLFLYGAATSFSRPLLQSFSQKYTPLATRKQRLDAAEVFVPEVRERERGEVEEEEHFTAGEVA